MGKSTGRESVKKSEVMKRSFSDGHESLRGRLNKRDLEKIKELKYLGATVSVDGKMEMEMSQMLIEEARMIGRLNYLWRTRILSIDAKVRMVEGIVTTSVFFFF